MFDIGTFDVLTFDAGNIIVPASVVIDTHDGVWDEETYKKYQEQLKKRTAQEKREFEQAQAKSAKLRNQLLNLYRGIENKELEAVPLEIQDPVNDGQPKPIEKIEVKPENLERIAVQLFAIADRLNGAQQRIIAEYRAEMDRQDEEEIELLLMEVL